MKTRLLLVSSAISGALAAGSLLPAAEVSAQAQPPQPALSSELVDPTAPEFAEIRRIGERALERIGYSMAVEASNNVAKKGVERAILLCHLKDVPKQGAVIPDMPRILAYKRTSLKLRDPANAPDEADQQALRRVRRDIENGTQPARLLLQQVEHANGKKEMRAYRPVATSSHCIPCHGAPEGMSEDVKALLKTRYPEDEATGYSVGEWRGLIRVTIGDAPPAAPAAAPAPAAKLPPKKS